MIPVLQFQSRPDMTILKVQLGLHEVVLLYTTSGSLDITYSHEITSLQEIETTTNKFAVSQTSLEDIQSIVDNEAEMQPSDETANCESETFTSTCAPRDSESDCIVSTEISSDDDFHSQAYLSI